MQDTDHFKWLGTVSEENLENLKQKREQTASFRQQIAVISLMSLTRSDPILAKWNSMTRKKKESTMIEVLVFIATAQGSSAEDDYQYAPEINTKYLCVDSGENLMRLLDHFKAIDPSELPGLDCPNVSNEDVWRMYDIKEVREGIPRPEGVRGIQNTILVRRNYFLSLFLVQLLVNLVSSSPPHVSYSTLFDTETTAVQASHINLLPKSTKNRQISRTIRSSSNPARDRSLLSIDIYGPRISRYKFEEIKARRRLRTMFSASYVVILLELCGADEWCDSEAFDEAVGLWTV